MTLTRNDTKAIKGIAILLMLLHHLYAFPDRVYLGLELISLGSLKGAPIEMFIASFGKICISLYMFLGGYALWHKSGAGTKADDLAVVQQVSGLYRRLWRVFLVFIPIAFLFFGSQPQYAARAVQCEKYAHFSLFDFFQNFIGFSAEYNSEWWFFKTYILAIFVGSVFLGLMKSKANPYIELAAVLLYTFVTGQILVPLAELEFFSGLWKDLLFSNLFLASGTNYIPLFLLGISFAKYDGIGKLRSALGSFGRHTQYLLCTFAILCIVVMRSEFSSITMDMIYVPMLIASCLNLISGCKPIFSILLFLGKHSTNMWLIHTFYCYYFGPFAKLVYLSRNVFVSFLTLLALSLGSSILLDWLWDQFLPDIRKRLSPAIRRAAKP